MLSTILPLALANNAGGSTAQKYQQSSASARAHQRLHAGGCVGKH